MNEQTTVEADRRNSEQEVSRVGLDLARALLHRQRQILALMLAERVRRVERASPERKGEINELWSRAIARQVMMVRRLEIEIDRFGGELAESGGSCDGKFAA